MKTISVSFSEIHTFAIWTVIWGCMLDVTQGSCKKNRIQHYKLHMVSRLKKGCNLWHSSKSMGPKSLLPAAPSPPPSPPNHSFIPATQAMCHLIKMSLLSYGVFHKHMGTLCEYNWYEYFFWSSGLCFTAFTGLTPRLWTHSSTVALAFLHTKDKPSPFQNSSKKNDLF